MKTILKATLFLWPGSTGTFRYGLWDQLAIALIFGAICNAVLFLNFYWVDLLNPFARRALLLGFVCAHLTLSGIAASRIKRFERSRAADERGDVFLEAQTRYLRQEWFETECILKSLVKKNPYDVEARLLLASVYRRGKQFEAAKTALVELERYEDSRLWREEIELEKRAIDEERRELKEEKNDSSFEGDASDVKELSPSIDDALIIDGNHSILQGCIESDRAKRETEITSDLDREKVA